MINYREVTIVLGVLASLLTPQTVGAVAAPCRDRGAELGRYLACFKPTVSSSFQRCVPPEDFERIIPAQCAQARKRYYECGISFYIRDIEDDRKEAVNSAERTLATADRSIVGFYTKHYYELYQHCEGVR